jgi:hypothetical protein
MIHFNFPHGNYEIFALKFTEEVDVDGVITTQPVVLDPDSVLYITFGPLNTNSFILQKSTLEDGGITFDGEYYLVEFLREDSALFKANTKYDGDIAIITDNGNPKQLDLFELSLTSSLTERVTP